MAQEQLCRYVTILQAKNPWTAELRVVGRSCFQAWLWRPRGRQGRSSTSASSLASPQALGLSYFIREAQVLKQLSGQLGPEGP